MDQLQFSEREKAHLHFAIIHSEESKMLSDRVKNMLLAGAMLIWKSQEMQACTRRTDPKSVSRREMQRILHVNTKGVTRESQVEGEAMLL